MWIRPSFIKRQFRYFEYLGLVAFFMSGILGVIYGLYISPPDYLHGDLVRILYVHVPCAWLSVSIYAAMGGCSIAAIVLRSSFYSICAQSLAVPGIILTVLCMITGSFWGKPAWGVWWVWDARLTSVVVLFMFYLGYLNICDGASNRAASLLNIVGLVNLPIIKWSVDWWFTLHQPATFSLLQKSGLATVMMPPLIFITISMIGWVCFLFVKRFANLQSNFQQRFGGLKL